MVPKELFFRPRVNQLLSPSGNWTISRLPSSQSLCQTLQTACRMNLFAKARDLGIQTEFIDGQGHPHVTAADALKVVFEALPPQGARQLIDGPVVVRQGHKAHGTLLPAARFPVRWEIGGLTGAIVGETKGEPIEWPSHLPPGVYGLRLTDAAGTTEEVPLVSAPARAFAGDFDRGWLLAVQLYGVRST